MNIESGLHYLLTRTEPFILLLKGEWGVGKTYFIKEFIKRHHHTFAKTTYSYVSLFGIPTTEEFMQTIFLNSMSMDMLEAGNLGTSSTDEISKRVKFLFDRAKPILSSVTRTPIFGVNNLRSFVVSNAAAFFNRNSLIVVDDLERHSPTLSVSDVMGILSQLKEERNCQIIIVMNEDALRTAQGGTGEAYFRTKEKVIDRELIFQPTVEDAIDIALKDGIKNHGVAEGCRKLKIANIRTILKIKDAVAEIRSSIDGLGLEAPDSFDYQLQTTLTIAVWCYWQGTIGIEDLEALQMGDTMRPLLSQDPTLTDEQKATYNILREYGYSYSDATDKILIRFVRTGILDRAELKIRIDEHQLDMKRRAKSTAIDQAWKLYNSTLKPNEDEVVTAIYNAHVDGMEEVQIGVLDGAIWLLRKLGQETKADDLIERFLHKTTPVPDYDSYPFVGMLNDHKFVEVWRARSAQSHLDERDLESTINSYFSDGTDHLRDLARLSGFTVEEYYRYFRNTEDQNVINHVKGLTHIMVYHPDYENFIKKVQDIVRRAVDLIASENKINALRVRSLFKSHDQQRT